jgi:hypothetical protein
MILFTLDLRQQSAIRGTMVKRTWLLADNFFTMEEKKQQCFSKRWKVLNRGRIFILSDVLEKVAVRVNKCVAVGDNAVQYGPGHAAIPCAATRFYLWPRSREVEFPLQSCKL